MPAYKYTSKDGKVKWYASFHYDDWMKKNRRKMKRGFNTRKEAQEDEAGLQHQERSSGI